ncbi:Beta propeller domain-containing protein [Amycolatopsis xylanica]|uniref:Beta propeller domain-containing protein n=1 Tax=Amycolatopsis xylanica TaxID=589385 RepID=A0A1H3RN48_9PSEU|nr:beta-propeller domain-containing protein [Amycolatopsis xylanica]SDZ26319.1 Beta propeller domain-containing protein [Amycolatopsis xylanica]
MAKLMTFRVAVACAAVLLAAASAVPGSPVGERTTIVDYGPVNEPASLRLAAFDSCQTALEAFKRALLPRIGEYGLPGGDSVGPDFTGARAIAAEAAPQDAAAKFSKTNTHEAGVDEPDVVKTDGKRLVSVADGTLRVMDVASRKLSGSMTMPGGMATRLLLQGDRALVVSEGTIMPDFEGRKPVPGGGAGPRLTLVDLSGTPKVLETLTTDGAFVDARQVGGVARIVLRSSPRLPFPYPADPKRNRDTLERSKIEDWLPHYTLEREGSRQEGTLVPCDQVKRPAEYSAASMLTVLTVDLAGKLGTGDPVSIVADGEIVYGTGTSLYIADENRADTEIHRFDIAKPGKPVHTASGSVRGRLLNQYSMSEYADHLRVATTVDGDAHSKVTVLDRKLAAVGELGGLGAGERIYAVRFLGPVGYVVTFRQTDPLYTVDLSDPKKPRAVGELKISGYSAYLHPAGDGRLIGVGQEASEKGRSLGTQVSLFDVRDPARPSLLAKHHLRGAHSEAEYDPHAFLYWPDNGLLVVPVDGDRSGGGALVLRLTDGAFTEAGTVSHDGGGVRRALVLGGALWTVSETGVLVSDLTSLARLAWQPFA